MQQHSENEWTAGPWRLTHTGFLGVGILPSTGELRTEGGPIITCWSACIGSAEAEANARLIAAAPELLEQVQLFVRCLEYEIRVSEKKGDDEGARLKAMTLAIAQEVVAKATSK